MSSRLYIRFRGRVLGPYNEEKLQALARRGQLSRMHELSVDGVSWQSAADYPDLFVSNSLVETSTVGPLTSQPSVPSDMRVVPMSSPAAQPVTHSSPTWYYMIANERRGPVSRESLQSMALSGQIRGETMVWAEGMVSWSPASNIGGLLTVASESREINISSSIESRASTRGSGAGDDLNDGLRRAAISARPWVLFIAITSFVDATLCLIGGILRLVQAGKVRFAPATEEITKGLFSMIYGGIMAVGGFLLLNYANRLAGVDRSRNAVVLEKALEALRHFWVFVSITLIVMLAFFVVAVVWFISVDGAA